MRRSRVGLAGVALVALTMIGCGSDAAATPAGQTPTPAGQTPGAPTTPGEDTGDRTVPCDTLRPQVQSIVGGTFYTGDIENTDTDTDCTYTFVDPGSGLPSGGVVNVRLETGQIDAAMAEYPGAIDVAGIGDQAFWSDQFGVLYCDYQGASWLVQIVLNGNITDRKGVATQVMQALFATM